MDKKAALDKVKKIGMRALEDMVKDVAMPMLASYVAEKNATAQLIFAALKGPLDQMADKIDGEVG